MDNLKAVYILYMSCEIPKDFTSYAHVKRLESRVTRWLNKFSIFPSILFFVCGRDRYWQPRCFFVNSGIPRVSPLVSCLSAARHNAFGILIKG